MKVRSLWFWGLLWGVLLPLGSASAAGQRLILNCRSIDTTFTPFYQVKVYAPSDRAPDNAEVKVSLSVDRGPFTKPPFTAQLTGDLRQKHAEVSWEEASLKLTAVNNRIFRGALTIVDEVEDHELSCEVR